MAMDNRICGVHAVYEALVSRGMPIERIHISRETHSGKLKEILDLAHEREVPIRKEERAVLDRMGEGIGRSVGLRSHRSRKKFSERNRRIERARPLGCGRRSRWHQELDGIRLYRTRCTGSRRRTSRTPSSGARALRRTCAFADAWKD